MPCKAYVLCNLISILAKHFYIVRISRSHITQYVNQCRQMKLRNLCPKWVDEQRYHI